MVWETDIDPENLDGESFKGQEEPEDIDNDDNPDDPEFEVKIDRARDLREKAKKERRDKEAAALLAQKP